MRAPRIPIRLWTTALVLALLSVRAGAQAPDCPQCHVDKAKGNVVHPAVLAGCPVCHSGVDASSFPHKLAGKTPRGLSAEPPELCFMCHDRKQFEGKSTHMPVAAGMCTHCHNPHTSEQPSLLKAKPVAVCLECHDGVKKAPHVIGGFSRSGHPLGDGKEAGAADPVREGKLFYCASCHAPHGSEFPRLLRFDQKSPTGFCMKCHRK